MSWATSQDGAFGRREVVLVKTRLYDIQDDAVAAQ